MKNYLLPLLLCLVTVLANGQTRPGKKYLNVGYSSQTLRLEEDKEGLFELKSKVGATFNAGRTYFLTKAPVAKLLNFGIDWTFIDLNYTQFKPSNEDFDEEESSKVQKAEIGMQVGPSVHLSIQGGFSVSAYLRYAPSYSLMYADEEFSSGYAGLMVAGLSANYTAFGFGIENRWGSASHNFKLNEETITGEGEEESVAQKFKLNGPRVFLSFRF